MGKRHSKSTIFINNLLVLIFSLSYFSTNCYSQKLDTISLKRDIEKVLKRHGLSSSAYKFVYSNNQNGGQTAFVISNNYGSNNHTVNGNNYGVNGDIIINPQNRIITKEMLLTFFKSHPDKKKKIRFLFINMSKESIEVKKQIVSILKQERYNNIDLNIYQNTVMPYLGSANIRVEENIDFIQFVIPPNK